MQVSMKHKQSDEIRDQLTEGIMENKMFTGCLSLSYTIPLWSYIFKNNLTAYGLYRGPFGVTVKAQSSHPFSTCRDTVFFFLLVLYPGKKSH